MERKDMLEDIEIINNFIESTKNQTIKWELVKSKNPFVKDYYRYKINENLTVELFYYNFTFYTYDGAEIPSIGYKLCFAVGSASDRYIKEIYDEEMGTIFNKLKELYTLVETTEYKLDEALKKLFNIN